MMPVLRWLCALSVALPTVAAPLRIAAAHHEDPSPPATPPDATAAADEPAHTSITDAIHAENVRLFIEHFQQGKVQYNRGAYALAAAEFEQAFAAMPAEAALRNVAESHERAGDDVAAAIAARRYMDLPTCDTPDVDSPLCASHREELEAALERLLGRIAELRLEIAPGVTLREIRINGRVTAREDFPVLVAAGRVDIELQGGTTGQRRQRVIEVRAGEKLAVVVDSFDAPIRVPDRDPIPGTQRPRRKWKRPAFWVGLGMTSASGIALATTGALTIVAERNFEREQALHNDNKPPVDENGNVGDPEHPYPAVEAQRYDRYRRASNVLVGVTAGLALVTVIVGIVAFTRPRNTGTTRASTRVRPHFTGSGFVLRY